MQSSVRQFNIMQKFIFFHDQGAFSVLFISSLLLHIILVLTIGIVSELWVKEPPPIRAKIGVSFTKAALASVECFKRARPNEKYRFEFTTSSKTIKDRLGKK